MHTFRVARWSWQLRLTSSAATALAAITAIVVFEVLSAFGVRPVLRVTAAALPLVAIAVAIPLIITSYTLTPSALWVARLFSRLEIPLDGVTSAWPDPAVLRPAKRVFGISGLFSYSCLCKGQALGRFHFYGTAPARAIVLFRPGRSVVVTPRSAEDFLACLGHLHPQITIRPKAPEA